MPVAWITACRCDTVLLEAARCNMGIIGMKSTTQGILLKNGTVTMAEAMRMPELHTTGEIGKPPGKSQAAMLP
ncbi:MAG: hypothetical protein WCJ35_25450 [Planctomycetota bacterium]